jgi:hypothetical protein
MGVSQEAKYVESWPNTTSAWAGWSRFDIPVDRYGGVHSLLICTSSILGSPTCHQASQQENTYCTKYQKADRASTLCTLWVYPSNPVQSLYISCYVTVNKLVLSYLLLRLLPQILFYVFKSGLVRDLNLNKHIEMGFETLHRGRIGFYSGQLC